jgi:riboflavin biosynthesis pyrimidine reductase
MKLIAVVAPPLQPCPWSPESRRHVRPASEVPWMVSRAAAQSPVATKARRASKNCTSSIANGGGDGVASRQDCPFVDTSSREYIVSSTLEDPDWNNSTVLKGNVAVEVSKLKQELDGEIVVYASFQLLRTLMEHDLVDELRLMIYPVVLGAGERLFGETSDEKPMRLLDTRTVAGDLAYLTYEPVRDA